MKKIILPLAAAMMFTTTAFAHEPSPATDTYKHGYLDAAAKVEELYQDTAESVAGVPSSYENLIDRFEMAWNGIVGDFNNLKKKHKELNGAHNDLKASYDSKVLQLALIQSAFETAKSESASKSLEIAALKSKVAFIEEENKDLKLSIANKTLQVSLLQSVINDLKAELAASGSSGGDSILKVAQLEIVVAGLKADLAKAEEKIASWKAEYNVLLGDISTLETEVAKSNGIINGLVFENNTLKSKVADAETALANKDGHIAALTAAYSGTIADLDATVATLEADKAHAWEVNAGLKGEKFNLIAQVEEANAKVATANENADKAFDAGIVEGRDKLITELSQPIYAHKTRAGDNFVKNPVDYITFVFSYIEDLQKEYGIK